MSDIGSLLCGSDKAEGIAKSALDQLARSIRHFSTKAVQFLVEGATEDSRSFGPFCARVLLENGCAALVGRLDCFRMLYLSEFQAQPAYEQGKRAKSAFSWTGDIISEEKPKTLWSIDHEISKISRALFSRHFDHIYWRPAVERMLDFVSAYRGDPMLSEILSLDAENYINEVVGRSSQLYSTLSKGVHWEFFSTTLMFDDATVKSTIRETCLLISHVGLTSHFIPTAYASLAPERAVEAYLLFRRNVP